MKKHMKPIVVRGILSPIVLVSLYCVYTYISEFLLSVMERVGIRKWYGVDSLWLFSGVMLLLILVNGLLNRRFPIKAYQTMLLNIFGAIVIVIVFWSIGSIFGMTSAHLSPSAYSEHWGDVMRFELFLMSLIYGGIVTIGSIVWFILQACIRRLRKK